MPETKQEKINSTVSPAGIWGKVISELRSNGHQALFIACGEIESVSIENNNFVIIVSETDKILLEIEENLKILQDTLRKFLPEYSIILKDRPKITEEPIIPSQRLIELFGEKLKIGE